VTGKEDYKNTKLEALQVQQETYLKHCSKTFLGQDPLVNVLALPGPTP